MRNPFKKVAVEETISKKQLEDERRAMAEELRSIIADYERKLAAEQEKVVGAEEVVDLALETFKRGQRIALESAAYGYGIGGMECDSFRLVKLEWIENVENAHDRYLRSQGRDPEALRIEDLEKRRPELAQAANLLRGGEADG